MRQIISFNAIVAVSLIACSSKRFKAAVSGASISNVFSGYGTDQYTLDYETELGAPRKLPRIGIARGYFERTAGTPTARVRATRSRGGVVSLVYPSRDGRCHERATVRRYRSRSRPASACRIPRLLRRQGPP